MNKVYKLIWSKTRNMYVAVCEFAKAHTKKSRIITFGKVLSIGILLSLLSLSHSTYAYRFYESESDLQQGTLEWLGESLSSSGGTQVNWLRWDSSFIDKFKNDAGISSNYLNLVYKYQIVNGQLYYIFYGKGKDTSSATTGCVVYNASELTDYPAFLDGNEKNSILPNIVDSFDTPNTFKNYGKSISFGLNTNNTGNSSLAIGDSSSVLSDDSIAVGTNAIVNENASNSVALGSNSVADASNIVSVGSVDLKRRITNVADGVENSDVITKGQLDSAIFNLNDDINNSNFVVNNAIGSNALAVGNNSSVPVTGFNAVAVGNGSTSSGNGSVAIGNLSDAFNTGSVAIGNNSNVRGAVSVGIGSGSFAYGDYSVALGYNSKIISQNSVALGSNSVSSNNDVISVGHTSTDTDVNGNSYGQNYYRRIVNVADGTGDHDVATLGQVRNLFSGVNYLIDNGEGINSLVMGVNSSAKGYYAIAVGPSTALGDNSIAFGTRTKANATNSLSIGYDSLADKENSIALGKSANSYGVASISIGSSSSASANGSLSLGSNVHTYGIDSVALGSNAVANKANSVALGNNSVANEDNVISVGSDTLKRRIVLVANGENDSDVATLGQVRSLITNTYGVLNEATGENAIAFGVNSIASGSESVAYGYNSSATGMYSVSLGSQSSADNVGATAVGYNSVAENDYATAIGSRSNALDNGVSVGYNSFAGNSSSAFGYLSSADGPSSVAIGNKSKSLDSNSIAIGNNAKSSYKGDIAIGSDALASNNRFPYSGSAIALGNSSKVYSGGPSIAIGDSAQIGNLNSNGPDKSIAIGYKSYVTSSESIALGNSSSASENYAIAIGPNASASGYNSVALGYFSKASERGVFSIGSDTFKRRIINVANGVNATDAVNKQQLDMVLSAVNSSMASAVSYDGDNYSKATFAGPNGTILSNVKAGALSSTSMEAVNGAQLYETNQNISGFANDITRNKNNIRDLNTSVSAALSSVSSTSSLVTALNDTKADTSLNNLTATGRQVITNAAINAVQEYMASQQGTTVNPIAPIAYNPNALMVTNAGNGSLFVGDGSNVNGSSSIAIGVGNQVNANNSGAFGDPSIINADESYVLGNDDTINTGATGSFVVGNDSVSSAKGGLTFGSNNNLSETAENSVALGNNVNISGKNSVALGSGSTAVDDNVISVGNDTLKRKITNVANGNIAEDSTDAVTGSQLFATNERVKANEDAIATKANLDASNIDVDSWTAKLGTGAVESGNTGLVNGGTVFTAIQKIQDNQLIQQDGDTLHIGSTVGGNTISVANNAGEGRVITGVATDPNNPYSATNVGYVQSVSENIINAVNNSISKVDSKVNKVGANAAALASLTPASFEGDEKWSLAASFGHYEGQTAGAVGAFYKPAENVMMNLRGSFASGENMFGGGVAVSLSKGDVPGVTKRQLAVKVNLLEQAHLQDRQEINQLEQAREQDQKRITELEAIVQKMAKQMNVGK